MKRTRQQFLEDRRKGIGSTDSAAILGVSPWKTKLHVQKEKLEGIFDEKEDELQKLGLLLEDDILQLYRDRTGLKPRRVNQSIVSKQWPWLIANLDARVPSAVVECKMCVFPHGQFGDEFTDDIPTQYVVQAQHQLAVTELELVEVPVLMFGKLRLYRVKRNDDLIRVIVDQTRDFWNKHILERVPVDPDFDHPTTLQLLNSVYPVETKTIDLPEQMAETVFNYQELGKQINLAMKARDSLKAELLSAIGDAEYGFLNTGQIVHRRLISRDGYEVKPTTYPELRIEKVKEAKNG